MTNLWDESIENLAQHVSEGSDSRAQKSQSVLLAKSVVQLDDSISEVKKVLETLNLQLTKNDTSSGRLASALNKISLAGVVIAAIIGGATLWVSHDQLHETHLTDSSDIILNFDGQLNQEPYVGISNVLDSTDSNTKILNDQNTKRFSTTQVENYIGIFEEIGNFYQEGVLDCSMINNDFGYQIQKAWVNNDIQTIVKNDQASDPTLWTNFVSLGKQFSSKNPCH